MKLFNHVLMMLYVSFIVSRMHHADSIDYLSAALKQARSKQHNQPAITFLESKKLDAGKRACKIVASASLTSI